MEFCKFKPIGEKINLQKNKIDLLYDRSILW